MTVSIGLGRFWVQTFSLVVGFVGLGQSADGFGWVGSHKMDPWTTLGQSEDSRAGTRRQTETAYRRLP